MKPICIKRCTNAFIKNFQKNVYLQSMVSEILNKTVTSIARPSELQSSSKETVYLWAITISKRIYCQFPDTRHTVVLTCILK